VQRFGVWIALLSILILTLALPIHAQDEESSPPPDEEVTEVIAETPTPIVVVVTATATATVVPPTATMQPTSPPVVLGEMSNPVPFQQTYRFAVAGDAYTYFGTECFEFRCFGRLPSEHTIELTLLDAMRGGPSIAPTSSVRDQFSVPDPGEELVFVKVRVTRVDGRPGGSYFATESQFLATADLIGGTIRPYLGRPPGQELSASLRIGEATEGWVGFIARAGMLHALVMREEPNRLVYFSFP
jgi:hypothetical protein